MQNSATYELRVDFSDGFEIARISADSIESARQSALGAEGAISTTLLAIVSQERQVFLAW